MSAFLRSKCKVKERKIMNSKKKEHWRIMLGIASILYIIFMWIKKDIAGIYNTMPAEQVVPLIATTIGVTAVKVAALAVIVLLMKWIISKRKNKND